MELALIFKTLGDDIRLRILGLLLGGELCVCDIESVLGISQVNVSRHLARMKSTGILTSRKNAQWVYYSVNRTFMETHPVLLDSLIVEFKKLPGNKSDMKKLAVVKRNKSENQC